jgi:hypothetical protein
MPMKCIDQIAPAPIARGPSQKGTPLLGATSPGVLATELERGGITCHAFIQRQ